jgi:hypothetical protein
VGAERPLRSASISSSDLPAVFGMKTKPTTPLMRRKIMRIRATGLMLKLASTGTKKLQMPRSEDVLARRTGLL